MGDFRRQVRHVLRQLVRARTFAAVTLVTLALGIGANTAIFSVLNGVLLKPLPYPDPERLVGVWLTAPGIGIKHLQMSPSMYFAFRDEGRTFQDIGMWKRGTVTVTGLAEPEEIRALSVTDGTLPILGVQPAWGRGFTRADDTPGTPETVILAYEYWQRRFGGDPSAIGRNITVDGRPREIIGVMPQGFQFLSEKAALIRPFRFDRGKLFLGNFSYPGLARLRPGATLAQANTDLARMFPIVERAFPPPPGFDLKMFADARIAPDVRPLKLDVTGDVGNVLWVLMGTIGMVLLIACANVANLLLARAQGRQQELAIRAALGASWAQIARELLLESLVLGVAGGALGLVFAWAALRLLLAIGPATLPRLDSISIDPPALLFTLAISLLAGLFFGLIPVFKYAGRRGEIALRSGGRTASASRERHRARSALVAVQVALALVLLIGSGLMIRSFRALKQVRPGFTRPEQVQTLRIAIPEAQVRDPERVLRMHHDILEKIKQIPEVTHVALASSVPMDGYDSNDPIFAEDRPYVEGHIPPIRRFKFISPDFFKTMGEPLVAGRDLTWTDVYNARPVALVSENLARELWRDPPAAIGKRIRESLKASWREIIGVVRDVPDDGVGQKTPAIVYWPILMKDFWDNATYAERAPVFAIRSRRVGSESFLQEIRQAVWSVNPNLPLAAVRTLEEIYDRSMARTSFTLVMLAIAGGMALVLALVGIYGVISYSVSQRTREIGIRAALGAQPGELKQMFVRHGVKLAGLGVVCGLAAAMALTRLMSSLLFGVKPVDPVTYVAVTAVLIASAAAASYVPARKATAVDPVESLRAE